MVASNQMSLTLKGSAINFMCRGTSGMQENCAWRILLGLFYNTVPRIIPTAPVSGANDGDQHSTLAPTPNEDRGRETDPSYW
jgi:hypothetical protein